MRYRITLSDPDSDLWVSQTTTGSILRNIGFTNLQWTTGRSKHNRPSLHTWCADGDEEHLTILKLSADVEKVVALDNGRLIEALTRS
jgi:hypothetical protein